MVGRVRRIRLIGDDDLHAAALFLAVMAMVFAAFIAWQGATLTSKQWVYLMTVPGGRWSWAFVFGVSATVCLYGLARKSKLLIGLGMFGGGFFCGFVAVCYTFAPLQDATLKTGGWWPWIVTAATYFGVGALSVAERE